MRDRILFMAAVIAVTACSGSEHGGSTEPPPPGKEVVDPGFRPGNTNIQGDSNIVLSANPRSNLTSIGPESVSWTLDSEPVGTGFTIAVRLRPGQNTVCVTAKGMESQATACVVITYSPPALPAIVCKILAADTLDTSLKSGLRITFSKDDVTVTRDVGLDGDCGVKTELALRDSVGYTLDASPGSARTYARRIGLFSGSQLAKGLVLLVEPLRRTLKSGSYSGTAVPFDILAAYRQNSGGYSFYIRSANSSGTYWYEREAFQPKSLPVPLAIVDSGQAFSQSERDTIVSAVSEMNERLGWQAFRLMSEGEVVDPSGHTNAVIMKSAMTCPDKVGACANSYRAADSLYGGHVWIRLSNFGMAIVEHELMHVLGFDHGCGWQGVMSVDCSLGFTHTLTQEDVAYLDAYYQTNYLERRYGAKSTLCDTHQGERTLQGLTEDRCHRDP